MKKLLSVCIPSYNMEKYLARNLDSFINSDCFDQLELIIVNDGSTDKTLEIAQQYKMRYPNSIIIIDKKNGHYGSCVNAALKLASAKYFRIVDADDWVDTTALTQVLQILDTINTDVVYTKYSTFFEIDDSLIINDDPADMIWNQAVDLNKIIFNKYVHMHQISYLTNYLKRIGYVQTEGICYTDTEYVYKPLIQATNIYCINISLYQYYVGRNDQSMAPNILIKNFSHLYKVLQSIIEYPHPPIINANYKYLYDYYVNALFRLLVDCLYASKCRNKIMNNNLRYIYEQLLSSGMDFSKYLSISIRGCNWFKLWTENTFSSRLKLWLFFTLIDIKYGYSEK